jgi:hypothetical protein
MVLVRQTLKCKPVRMPELAFSLLPPLSKGPCFSNKATGTFRTYIENYSSKYLFMNSLRVPSKLLIFLTNSNGRLLAPPRDDKLQTEVSLVTMNNKYITLTLATVALSSVAFAQSVTNVASAASDVFQITYASNLNVGDSFLNFTNSGATTDSVTACAGDGTFCGNVAGPGTSQNLCINLYTFDPQEELIDCCTCSVTPNGLVSLSVVKSLISNPLTPAIPTAVVVKAVASTGSCNASQVGTLAHGLLAWGTTLHKNTSTAAASYSVTETPFSQAAITAAELGHITSVCGFIQADGSGFGICKGCPSNGLGATSTQ